MMNNIKLYFWFIGASQDFMKGYNPVKVFFQSIFKGFGFVRLMNRM